MRIRYIFNVFTRERPDSNEWTLRGPMEADAGTLYGAQQQVQLELATRLGVTIPFTCLRTDCVAAIGLTGR